MTHASLWMAALIFVSATCLAQDELQQVKAERNPGRRSELAIELADKTVDEVRSSYRSRDVAKAEQQLELIGSLADECLSATEEAHKAKYWKRQEQKIASLARRVRSLIDDLDYNQRDKATELHSHLEAVHDKLLAGVMGK